jgi:hypothetical protein
MMSQAPEEAVQLDQTDLTKGTKWRLFNRLTVGGTEHSSLGFKINVSANGTSTVSPSDLKKVMFKHFAEMDKARQEVVKSDEF